MPASQTPGTKEGRECTTIRKTWGKGWHQYQR